MTDNTRSYIEYLAQTLDAEIAEETSESPTSQADYAEARRIIAAYFREAI